MCLTVKTFISNCHILKKVPSNYFSLLCNLKEVLVHGFQQYNSRTVQNWMQFLGPAWVTNGRKNLVGVSLGSSLYGVFGLGAQKGFNFAKFSVVRPKEIMALVRDDSGFLLTKIGIIF